MGAFKVESNRSDAFGVERLQSLLTAPLSRLSEEDEAAMYRMQHPGSRNSHCSKHAHGYCAKLSPRRLAQAADSPVGARSAARRLDRDTHHSHIPEIRKAREVDRLSLPSPEYRDDRARETRTKGESPCGKARRTTTLIVRTAVEWWGEPSSLLCNERPSAGSDGTLTATSSRSSHGIDLGGVFGTGGSRTQGRPDGISEPWRAGSTHGCRRD